MSAIDSCCKIHSRLRMHRQLWYRWKTYGRIGSLKKLQTQALLALGLVQSQVLCWTSVTQQHPTGVTNQGLRALVSRAHSAFAEYCLWVLLVFIWWEEKESLFSCTTAKMYWCIPFSLFSSPQYTQYCLQKTLSRSIRRMYFCTDQAKESVISVILPNACSSNTSQWIRKAELVFSAVLLLIPISPLLWSYGGFGSTLWPFATISHLLHLWLLIFLERMLRCLHTHLQPPGSLWAHLWLCHWVWRARDPQAFTTPGLQRVLPHCSFQTLRNKHDELLFLSIQKNRYKMGVSFPSFSSWRGWFFSCFVIQLSFSSSIINYIPWLTNKCPISSGN